MQAYPAREADGVPPQTAMDCCRFRKRIGPGYDPNVPPIYAGTSTQELLRVIIDRTNYVDTQRPHKANIGVIRRARDSLIELEFRAAELRGITYYEEWGRDLVNWFNAGKKIEAAEPC